MEQPRVLIVDDTPANIIAMRMVLKSMPVNIFEAKSGNEALGILLRERVDMVLMDVKMPMMDGYETAACLGELDEYREIPIVFVTGNDGASKESAGQFRDAPHVFKPFEQEELKQIVSEILAERHKEVHCA